MSQHAIEDLVEETALLLDNSTLPASARRDYLAGIYRMQGYYDTGYTHFRVIAVLLKNKFVYRIAAEDYPGNLDEDAYTQEEDGKTFVYVDAGSESWKKSCNAGVLNGEDYDPVNEIPTSTLIHTIMQEAEKQGDQTLLNNWYGLLVNGYLDGIFEELPKDITELAAQDELLAIRDTAIRNSVKRLRKVHEDVMLPVLSDEVQSAGGLEKEFAIRFFLDLKKSPEALITAYQKAAKAKVAGLEAIDEIINGDLHSGLASRGWMLAPSTENNTWIWYRDDAPGRRIFWVTFEEADKFLMCQMGMQHRLLLEWQQREADTTLANMHLYQMAVASLPESRQEDKKFIHPYGGWKFDITKPKKTLKAQIDHLLEDIQIAEEKYFSYLDEQFPEEFFKRDPERLLYLMEEGEDETGIVPDYVLLSSPYAVLLCFAYYYHAQGDDKQAKAMIGKIEKHLKGKSRRSAYDTQFIEPFLAAYEKDGFAVAMPPLFHHLIAMALMKAG